MPARPVIGIPCFQQTSPAQVRPSFVMYQTYTNALIAAGAIPFLIPLQADDALDSILPRLDGVLLAGGDDMNPVHYQQDRHPKSETPDDLRDQMEMEIARRAVDTRLPLLAICRGLQVLNVAFGGTLIQHIPDLVPGAIQHEFNYDDYHQRHAITHEVEIQNGSRLAAILGTPVGVNSFHHQAVGQVADRLQAVGYAPDGVVEALEGREPDQFVVAVQWHPEDMFHTSALMLGLFQAFVVFIEKQPQSIRG